MVFQRGQIRPVINVINSTDKLHLINVMFKQVIVFFKVPIITFILFGISVMFNLVI